MNETLNVERPAGLAAATGSAAVVSREKVMEVEVALMKAATDFGRAWGCDQREHPRSYWLELHIERWGELTRCALAYADCFGEPPNYDYTTGGSYIEKVAK